MGTPALVPCLRAALGVVAVADPGREYASLPCCSSRAAPLLGSPWRPPSHRRLHLRRSPLSAWPPSSSSSSSSSSPAAEHSCTAHAHGASATGPSASQPPFHAAGSPPSPSSDPPLLSLTKSAQDNHVDVESQPKQTAAQSAMAKVMAYKKMKSYSKHVSSSASSPSSSSSQPQTIPSCLVPPSNLAKVEIPAGTPDQVRTSFPPNVDDASANPDLNVREGNTSSVLGPSNSATKADDGKVEGSSSSSSSTVALSALERAKAYTELQQLERIAALNTNQSGPAPEGISATAVAEEENVVEVEIHTRDGIVRRKVLKPETAFANVKDIQRKGVSTLDFVGLGFADKKSSTSRPAGLHEAFETPSGPLPEVEVLTRDAGVADPDAMVEGAEVYKPRVTTWGMFPRPADISKAYGGGRTIKPGQKLETEEEKIARETKTKKLLSEYKKKFGLDMAPKDRVRCERNMKNGEDLMDSGQLREAQATFIIVMEEMPFLSELHGMAALQEAVCLESLNKSDEAKIQYEKLLSHPNGAVRKKARQLLFGFQAAERLKVRADYNWDSSSYRKYFDAFANGYNTMYTKKEEEEEEKEEALMQNWPFALLLLVLPVILVVTLVAIRS